MSSGLTISTHGKVPAAAAWLGGLGAIPFVGLSIAIPFADAGLKPFLEFALMAYGAIILSFLGGIRWGLAVVKVSRPDHPLAGRLGLSVTPSLIAWAALIVPGQFGWIILAAAFVAMLLVDILASRVGEAPVWYPRLRWPLTCAAVAGLLIGNLA